MKSVEPEVFAATCAVESPTAATHGRSWTTGQGTGSDPDD